MHCLEQSSNLYRMMTEQYDLSSSFQIQHTVSTGRVHIPLELLPKQYIDGKVRTGNTERCHISYGKQVNKGGHGNITLIRRTPALSGDLCVKTPHKSEYSLCSEAILQVESPLINPVTASGHVTLLLPRTTATKSPF